MKIELYTIRTLTNLHVGSGEINFDIVDNQVQRDDLGRPHINSSSLKGALREHFSKNESTNKRATSYIFGPENNENIAQSGAYKFFEASLLTRPVRSNVKPYFNAITVETIEELLEQIEDFSLTVDNAIIENLKTMVDDKPDDGHAFIYEALESVKIEHIAEVTAKPPITGLENLLGSNLVLLHSQDMEKIALPVLARNYLKNGESKNLWYEEVVPKRSRFYCMIGRPNNEDAKDLEELNKFNTSFEVTLSQNVQIGANATIGYGYTKIQKATV